MIIKNIIITLSIGHNERVYKRSKLAVGLIVPPGKVLIYEGCYPPPRPTEPEKANSTARHMRVQQKGVFKTIRFDLTLVISTWSLGPKLIAKVCFAQCSTSRLDLGSPGCLFVCSSSHSQNTL